MSKTPRTDRLRLEFGAGKMRPGQVFDQMAELETELAEQKKLSESCSRDCNNTALERNTLRAQLELAQAALRDAREMVEDWGAYASDYFRGKHDLAGDLAKLDAAIDAARAKEAK